MKELATLESIPLEELREQVMDGLVRRFSTEGVSMEDFERRTSLATRAMTKAELLVAVEGLPEEAPTRSRAVAPASASGWRVATGSTEEHRSGVAIFSGFERKGVWKTPRRFEAFCVFGGGEIDLRKAIIPREGTTISCLAIFGGMDVIVPPDMRIEVAGLGIFGGFDHKQTDASDDAPLVRIEGLCVFGGVGIKVKA